MHLLKYFRIFENRAAYDVRPPAPWVFIGGQNVFEGLVAVGRGKQNSVDLRITSILAAARLDDNVDSVPFTLLLADTSDDAEVRGAAAEALSYSSDPLAIFALRRHIADPNSVVRFWVVYAIGESGDFTDIDRLIQCTDDAMEVDGQGTVGQEARLAIESISARLEE